MCTRSIAPMCIQVKDHSRVLCEQLQQLRLQTGLVDLDIVCEDHHINVHKVVMAACSKFFKEQLCKQNVQVPVILRLEDFGLELKREALAYIIEFVYRGEVNIPGEKLTEVCQAAHSLGVVGLEHLPVPAETQRPALISKEHLQIADESELRSDINNMYNNFSGAATVQPVQPNMNKFNMDIGNINPFFINNNAIQNDDIILLQTTDEDNRNINNEPDIIPISFGDSPVVSHNTDIMSGGPGQSRLYPSNNTMNMNDKMNLIVSEPSNMSGPGEQYRIIPEILSDGTFHEESIDSCLPFNFHNNSNSSEAQDLSPSNPSLKTPVRHHHGKNISNLAGQSPVSDVSVPPVSVPSHPATSLQALFEAAEVVAQSGDMLARSSCSSIVFSSPSSTVSTISCTTPVRPSAPSSSLPTLQQIKPSQKSPVRGKHNSMSGKLRVINQGILSENIQSPSNLEKSRRRSGQVSGCQVGPKQDPVSLNVSQDVEDPDDESDSDDTDTILDTDQSQGTPAHGPVFGEDMWSSSKSWTHPVESVDTSVPTSGAVWQLPSTDPPAPVTAVSVAGWSNSGVEIPVVTSIPWNTPVVTIDQGHVSSKSRDTPPNVSVAWTQPQTSASPSPAGQGVLSSAQPPYYVGQEVELSSSINFNSSNPGSSQEPVAGPSNWRINTDDNMLAIRTGIPLALQNKAIRSGVPIGPFQNKRKRKSRCSQEGGKVKKKVGVGEAGKRGDLEVRKDLILEPQNDVSNENVFVSDEASTSNIVSRNTGIIVGKTETEKVGGVHIKTVKKLNSDAVVAELELGVVSDISNAAVVIGQAADNIAGTGAVAGSPGASYQYSCVSCSLMFASAAQLKRHSQQAHGASSQAKQEETILCQVCNEHCLGRETFMMHLYKSHGIGEILRCEECNFETPVKAVYIKHISEHDPQNKSKMNCPKCPKVFKSKHGLDLHLKQHLNESLFSCPACDFKTPQKQNLIKHTTAKHGLDVEGRQLDANIQCELCDFRCIAEHMLKNHIMRKHTQKSDMRFKCPNCDYATVEQAALDKHIRFKHTNERPYMCGTCGFSTHTASAMSRHKRSHQNAKPYKCDVCAHEYADKKRLRDHMYLHDSDHKPFSCQICGCTFRRKDGLSLHIKKQHGDTKMEKCEVTVPDSTSGTITSPKPDVEPPKPTCPAPSDVPVSVCNSVVAGSSSGTSHSMSGSYTVYTSQADNDEVIFVSQNDNPGESSS